MRRISVVTLSTILTAAAIAASTAEVRAELSTKEIRRIEDAASVLKEIHGVPDKDIPSELWDRAKCVIVVPGLKKAAFIIGGEYGKGLIGCRKPGRAGTAPVFIE